QATCNMQTHPLTFCMQVHLIGKKQHPLVLPRRRLKKTPSDFLSLSSLSLSLSLLSLPPLSLSLSLTLSLSLSLSLFVSLCLSLCCAWVQMGSIKTQKRGRTEWLVSLSLCVCVCVCVVWWGGVC